MKNKISPVLVSVLVLVSAGFVFSSASAQEALAAKPEKVVEAQGAKGSNSNAQQNNVADTTITAVTTETTNAQDKIKKDKLSENKGQVTAQEHRSTVATFVQSLLAVADREGGIGQQVKVIAQQQNASKEEVAVSIDKVEKRGKLKTFFIGSDYKNLGDLRSQMVQTRNQVDQLKRLADKATTDQDKTELQTQIQALEQQQANIDTFITQNESKFSLFGWAVKLFNK